MHIQLTRPLAIFDLETTGINITQDRIIEIAILKIHPDGKQETYEKRVNPEKEMTAEVIAIHGIKNEDLADCPTFAEIANEVQRFIEGCDLGGFNSNKFDVPVLVEEMLRVGIDPKLENRKFVDVQNIFHKMEQRTLSAAYRFYCDKNLDNAHSALADAAATWEILDAQVARYEELQKDIPSLAEFSQAHDFQRVDFAGRLARNESGDVLYNFGKHRGKSVFEIHQEEPGYYGWMLNADFPLHTKLCLRNEMNRLKEKGIIASADREADMQKKLSQLKNKFKE